MTVTYNTPWGQELSAWGNQCLYTIPSVSTDSWLVMETQPARGAPVTQPAVHSQTSSHSGHTAQHEVGVGLQASFKPPTKDWFSAGPTPPAPQHQGKQQHGEREGGCQQQPPQTYGGAQGTSRFKHRWTG